MKVRQLITEWGFKVDKKPLERLEKNLGSIKSTVALVGGAAIAAGGAMFGLAKHIANIGDNAAKTAKSVGLTAESLQALQFAASISGVEQQAMNTSLQKFSRNILEAQRGTETYARSFRELGVANSVLNDKNADTETILKAVADRISKMPDGFKKTGLAMELFGRTGAKLIPLLNEGSSGINKLTAEARELGFVMGEEDTKNAEAFNDAITRLMAVFRGIKILIGKDLLPVIEEMVDQFRDWMKTNKEFLKVKLLAFMKQLIRFVKNAIAVFKTIFQIVGGIVTLFGGFERVIRLVTLALIGLVGAQTLMLIGKMAMGFVQLIGVIRKMGMAAALANVKAMLIPILIGAALVALGLIIEDIIAFFEGKDSVTGIIVQKFKDMFKILEEKFNKFGTVAKIAIAIILTPIRAVIANLRTMGKVVGAIKNGKGIKGVFSALKGGLADAFAPQIALAKGEDISLGGAIGLGGSGKPGNVQNSSKSNIVNNLKVEVPPQLSAEQAATATQLGVKDAMATVLRETSRQVSTPIAE